MGRIQLEIKFQMVRQFDEFFFLKKRYPKEITYISSVSFFRYRVPQREMDRRGGDRSQPLHTPAMAGKTI